MPSSKNAVVLVVISFLLVIMIYSSVSIHVVFANTTRGPISCVEGKGPFGTYACCQKETDSEGMETTWCTVCDKYTHTNCSPRFSVREGSGNTPSPGSAQPPSTPPPSSNETHVNNLPGNIGTVQTPSTPPPSLNAIPPPSALPSPMKQQTLTTTCPDGSAPDANGNCSTPTTTTNQQNGLTSNNNNNPQQGHHHKGSNQPTQTGGGGQELTATKKHKGSKTDQGTTQPPS